MKTLPLEDAKEQGALFFGDKYGDVVRMDELIIVLVVWWYTSEYDRSSRVFKIINENVLLQTRRIRLKLAHRLYSTNY